MYKKICKNCNKIFFSNSEKTEFCNSECRYNYYNVPYTCYTCGKEFITKRTMVQRVKDGKRKHLYCPECTNNGNGTTDIINKCIMCGKEFRVSKAFSNQLYCSVECSNKGRIKFSDIECPICKKIFHPKSEDTIFCSNECKFRASQNRIKCTCHYCGKEVERKLSEYEKNTYHYCDKICHYLDISWSEHDINIVRENYYKIKTRDILSLLDGDYTYKALKSEVGRLGLYDEDHYWTDEETSILKDNYSSTPMAELMKLLPNRTRSSIIGKGRQCNLLSYHYINNTYSDEENDFLSNNYLKMSNEELSNHINRSPNGIAQHLWHLGLYRPKEKSKYESLNKYVRGKILVWVNKVKAANNYTCCITGNHENIILHHCRGFNLLMLETIDDLNFEVKENVDEYTQQELDSFVEYFLYLQEYYGEYCCITEDIHKLFHKYYGYGNNTMEQWNEFVKKYNNNQYKLIA